MVHLTASLNRVSKPVIKEYSNKGVGSDAWDSFPASYCIVAINRPASTTSMYSSKSTGRIEYCVDRLFRGSKNVIVRDYSRIPFIHLLKKFLLGTYCVLKIYKGKTWPPASKNLYRGTESKISVTHVF